MIEQCWYFDCVYNHENMIVCVWLYDIQYHNVVLQDNIVFEQYGNYAFPDI